MAVKARAKKESSGSKLKIHEMTEKIRALDKSQAVIEFNMDGTIIVANENFLNVVGYGLEEIQGKHHSMFVEPEYKTSAAYREFWEKLNRGEYEAAEYKRLGKGGKEVWIQASYNPIFDLNGNPFKVVKYATDVTEQKRQAIEMARVKTSLDNANTNVLVCDREYKVVYLNQASIDSLYKIEKDIRQTLPNFSVDKILGSSIDDYHKNPSVQRRILDDPGNLPHEVEIQLGPLKLVLVVNAILSEKGEYLGNVLEWTDITAERIAQSELERMIQAAAQGNLSERIRTEGFEGFYKSLSDGVNKMLQAVMVPLNEAQKCLGHLSEGDLTVKMEGDYQGTYKNIKESLNTAIEKLTHTLSSVRTSAEVVANGVTEISHGNDDLSQRTSEQASALEETSSSMEEMTSTVKQNAENAKQASQLALAARDVAEKGRSVTSKTNEAMEEVNKSSKKIVDIISVIDEIAFQTNLLALNAAVEAARAGEHGRGFGVVATEVRNLAQRSATAAKEIKSLINESVSLVTNSTDLVNQSGQTLEEIVGSVKRVTDVIGEISAASQEQSNGIDQVNRAIIQMDQTTQQNAALVEEATSTSHGIKSQTDELLDQVDFFRFDDATEGARERRRVRAEAVKSSSRERERKSRETAHAAEIKTKDNKKSVASVVRNGGNGNGDSGSSDYFDEF